MEFIRGGRPVAGCCGSGATRLPMCFFLFIWHIHTYLIYDSVCIVPSYPLIGEKIDVLGALNHCARTSQWSEPTSGLLGWQDSSGSDFFFQTPILADPCRWWWERWWTFDLYDLWLKRPHWRFVSWKEMCSKTGVSAKMQRNIIFWHKVSSLPLQCTFLAQKGQDRSETAQSSFDLCTPNLPLKLFI